jgi:shikimate dehydrogenase
MDFVARAREFFAHGGWGANVTVPHKVAALALTEHLDPEASAAGAVNTFYRQDGLVRGANTDVIGLRRELLERREWIRRAPFRLAVVGAGGAARAVVVALHEHCARIDLFVRRAERGHALVRDLACRGVFVQGVHTLEASRGAAPLECTLLIDATSAWVCGEVWSLPPGSVSPGALFYTLSYGKEASGFHRLAERHKADDSVDGWGLLVEQAAAAFALWTGVSPPTETLHELPPSA